MKDAARKPRAKQAEPRRPFALTGAAVIQSIRSGMDLKQRIFRAGVAFAAASCVLLVPAWAQAKSWAVSVTGFNYNALPIDRFTVETDAGSASGANMPGLAYSGGEGSGSTCCYRVGGKTMTVKYQLWTAKPDWKRGDPEPPFITRTAPFPAPSDPKARILEVYFLPDGSVQGKLVSERDRGPIPYSRIMDRIHNESLDFILNYPKVQGRDVFSERFSHAIIRGWLLGLRSEADLYDFSMRALKVNAGFAEDPSIAPGLDARRGNPRAIMAYLQTVPDATWKRLAAEQKHYDETELEAQDAHAKHLAEVCKDMFTPCKAH
ncbi:hypothetical protein [Paraburkholderia acidisoli]|uniref:DUF3304 domain-containing protein n=1 Tax=Paraburkholderia acidisoli TaxID=2571748 RepID=A0A7Z2JJC6_9BURK|nr:hypothetical protein [Paraburkholderia acidisoli]QGZ66083.1 DUF3304 domain-containing protein [Paraburkholderia acidisoli]